MKQLSFEHIAKSAIAGSPILSDEMVAQYSLNTEDKPLYAYLYRIAAYAVDEIRHGEEFKRDDEAYIDALQECVLAFPQLLSGKRTHKLATYAQHAFRAIAVRYLMAEERGGMAGESGRWAHECSAILSLEDLAPREDDEGNDPEDTWDDAMAYSTTPMGYRDPLAEIAAQDAVTNAQTYIARTALSKTQAARLREEIGKS